METGMLSNWKKNIRIYILQFCILLIGCFLLYRLWELQIVNGRKYADEYELKITRTVRESNTRGMIYDCNGEVLAYNKLVLTVTMTDNGDYSSDRERQLTLNSMIYRVVRKLSTLHEQVNNELCVKVGENGHYEYTVSGNALLRFKADLFGKAEPGDMTPEQMRMSADEVIDFLAGNQKFALYGEGKRSYTEEELQAYGLPGEYTKEEVLAILGIRYMLSVNTYRKYVPVILARDVSEETAAYVLENNQLLPGIDIGQDWERVYDGGEAFSHILGYTGRISQEELERYAGSDRCYTADSMIGKAGIEQYMEKELQGIDGEREILVNNRGKITGEGEIIREMESGQDIWLSIDKDLQIAVYEILEKKLADIIADHLINAKEFDKTDISDTTDIRIPIYDVYMAFIDNNILHLQDFERPGASEQELLLAEILKEKQGEVQEALRSELREGNTTYDSLSGEMREYLFYLIEETGLLGEEKIDVEDEVFRKWKSEGGISPKTFLLHAIDRGWIAKEFLDFDQRYLTRDEMYELLTEELFRKIADDIEFKKRLFKWLLYEDRISGRDICLLLYEQGILSGMDSDYAELLAGRTDAFLFLKKKIMELEITPAQLALDPCSASAVVVNPQNGKILALVSYPGYDNNRLANQIDSAYYQQLLNDKSLPLYNRATQQLTAPGSTFKPVTVAAGLQEGVIFPDTSVYCDGIFDKVFPGLKCWKHTGHGEVGNAWSALQFSCNDYLCEIAYRLGTGADSEYTDSAALWQLQKYAQLFRLDEKSGIELAESEPHVTDNYAIPSAIGQGTHNYATVQLARYVNILASGGKAYPLSLIRGVADENGRCIETEPVTEDVVDLPDNVWNTVGTGMRQFAKSNAAFEDMEIPVAGKTGTAQESEGRPDHALFVGYAPADAPEITIAVRIANGYGSSNVTAVGRSVFDYYFGEMIR